MLVFLTTSYSQVIYGWDDDDFHIPGTLFTSITITVTTSSDSTIISQAVDDIGLVIYGFDNESDKWLQAYIGSAGLAHVVGKIGLNLDSLGGSVFITPDNDDDVHIHLGDAAGAQQWQLEDSGTNIMASINSDGDLNLEGSIDFNSVAAGARDAIEAVVVLSDMQGAVIDGQVPNTITINNASTIQTSVGFNVGGSAGLSATYNFGGGGTGDIATMTFVGGILTAVTTVP